MPKRELIRQWATGASQLLVQLPNGKVDVFTGGAPIRFADTSQIGHYTVTQVNAGSVIARNEFVADRLSVAESNIAPQVDPAQLSQNASPAGQPSEHEVWHWLAGGALLFLGAEWLIYFRRLAV